jgi:aldose 1-dehydrogenase [NAD(P)+]
MKLNIIIVDDSSDMMRGMRAIVETMERLQLAGEEISWQVHPILAKPGSDHSVNIPTLAKDISRLQPGVAIVDMRLEGDGEADLSGVELSLRIRALCPDCCIILVSSYFGMTPMRERFEHLEVFRSLVSRSLDSAEESNRELKERVAEAILTHASTVNYRRYSFAESVNGGSHHMWGLVLRPDGAGADGKARLSIERQLPIPYLGSHSVVVRLIEAGVCGTDRKSLALTSPPAYSVIDFHEAFGRVVWTGEAVRSLKEGDYVIPMVRRCETWDLPPDGAGIEPQSFVFRRCDDAIHRVCYPGADQCPVGEFRKEEGGRRCGYKSRGTGKCHGFGSQYFVDTEEWLIRIELPRDRDLRKRMMRRYVLAEPMSIVWKAHREILAHRMMREYRDRVLIIGLGPIGLLAATVMYKLHPGLDYMAVDLAPETNERVKVLIKHLPEFRFVRAEKADAAPPGLTPKSYDVIIEATDQPDKVFKYASSLLAPGGILVLIGISEEGSRVDIDGGTITDLVKRGNTLVGSVNSSRSDFEDSIAFMERVLGDEKSILNDVADADNVRGMVTRLPIDDDLPERLAEVGRKKPWEREEIKVVLRADA